MKFKKIFCLIIAACLLAIPMAGCQKDDPKDDSKDGDGTKTYTLANIAQTAADYTLVRPETCSTLVTDALKLARNVIKEKGMDLEPVTDWIERGTEPDSSAREILIGNTNRPESTEAAQGLKEDQYAIKMIGNKICIVGSNDYATRNGVYEFLSTYFGYVAPDFTFHNVKDYGAEGDGKRDDTDAFKAAIKAAESDGLPVYVPAGSYIVTETLVLNSVTLYGYNSGAWTADNCDLPLLYHSNLEEPLFNVKSGSVSGLNIKVQGVSEETKSAAETIRITNTGGRVSNLTIRNPYIGITTHYDPDEKEGNPGRCFIENIFIVEAYNTGVNVYGTRDVATLCNIEVWNPNSFCPVAFRFGDNDDLRAVNLFAFKATVGFLFEETEYGSCWASFSNCSVDYTSIGIRVGEGNHQLTFTGGTWWTHHKALDVTAKATNAIVVVSGCEMKSNGDNTINIAGGSQVAVSGCALVRNAANANPAPVKISGGGIVNVSGNSISANGMAVQIESTFKGAATICGNAIATSRTSGGIQNSAKNATVEMVGNAILNNQKFE